jgi:hypothetical protein
LIMILCKAWHVRDTKMQVLMTDLPVAFKDWRPDVVNSQPQFAYWSWCLNLNSVFFMSFVLSKQVTSDSELIIASVMVVCPEPHPTGWLFT